MVVVKNKLLFRAIFEIYNIRYIKQSINIKEFKLIKSLIYTFV